LASSPSFSWGLLIVILASLSTKKVKAIGIMVDLM